MLLFSYGSFRNGSAVIADRNAVNSSLSSLYGTSLDANTAIAFHVYGTTDSEATTTIGTVRGQGIAVVSTEMQRGESAADCTVTGKTTAAHCLVASKVKYHEEKEVSWLSFLQLGPDVDADASYQQRVVAQMDYGIGGNAIIWIPDYASATWPVQEAPPCGSTVALFSVTDQKWVQVISATSLLQADSATNTGSAAKYDVVCNASGTFLQSKLNSKYVDPGWTSTTSALIANATTTSFARSINWLVRPDGRVILRAQHSPAYPSWRIVSVNSTSKQLFDNQTLYIPRARFTATVF